MSVLHPDSQLRHRILKQPKGTTEFWLQRSGNQVSMHTKASRGSSGSSNWNRCHVDNCLGEAVVQDLTCLKHASQDERKSYIQIAIKKKTKVSLRGVEINQLLMDEILRDLIIQEGDKKIVKVTLSLACAEVSAMVHFKNYIFEGGLEIYGGSFYQTLEFIETTFHGGVYAAHIFFSKAALAFTKCTFKAETIFNYAVIPDSTLGFTGCDFERQFRAEGLECGLHLREGCHLKSDLILREANAKAIFLNDCTVMGELDVQDAHCNALHGNNLQAKGAHLIGPISAESSIRFTRARFSNRIHMEIESPIYDMSSSVLETGGSILANGGKLEFKNLNVKSSLRVSGKPNNLKQPLVMDLQGADVGMMTFSHVDMSCCLFNGSHNLSEAVIESTVIFAQAPSWWRSKRRCIAEEYAWRNSSGRPFSLDWKLPGTRLATAPKTDPVPGQADPIVLPVISPSQIAGIYRGLRRSFEGKSDEPGAADFYYGEMEMRRHDKERTLPERWIIFFYWTLSGYGLRASRAIIAYILLMLVGAYAMISFGFQESCKTFLDGLAYSVRSTIPGLQNNMDLTLYGKFIEPLIKILGAFLFALTVLAIRARVKR